MTSPNPFIKPVDDYNRDLDFVPGYLEGHAQYISAMTGDPYEQCLEFVRTQSKPDGLFPLHNPKVLINDKAPNGDRTACEVTLMQFVNRVAKQDLRMAPSLSAYMPEEMREASHSLYIQEGVANRAKTRKEQLFQESINTPESLNTARIRKGQQENYKLNNNSYSGAALSEATILFNKSTHPALTSTCRVATSYANANNEKFIMGNRHYYNAEVTIANIISIAQLTDLEVLHRAMVEYNLHWPSADDVVDVVKYSSDNYIHDGKFAERVRLLASGLNPVQRAAIVYVGDLYHMYKYNPEFIKTFLVELSQLGDPTNPHTEEEYNALDVDIRLFANFVCYAQTKGRNHDKLRAEEPEVFKYIYSTTRNIVEQLSEYRLLIQATLLTPNLPSSIFSVPSIYRKAVPVSDTDSTMFTCQYWVEEIFGAVIFTPEALRLVFGMTFLISGTVMHILAIQSANMGVSKAKLNKLAMKNEYFFALLSLTNRSKHYFASQDALEGIMFLNARMEVKGVGLRNSKIQPRVNRQARMLMQDIIDDIKAGRKIHLRQILKDIADLERMVFKSIADGEADYLTTGQCKRLNQYKSEDNSTYAKYVFWQEVFSPTYGDVQPPPHTFVKLSVTANNRTRFREWTAGLEDRKLAQRLDTWHLENGNKILTSVHVPAEVIERIGVPEPLRLIADSRRIVIATMEAFYLILEVLGVYLTDKDHNMLVSDFY